MYSYVCLYVCHSWVAFDVHIWHTLLRSLAVKDGKTLSPSLYLFSYGVLWIGKKKMLLCVGNLTIRNFIIQLYIKWPLHPRCYLLNQLSIVTFNQSIYFNTLLSLAHRQLVPDLRKINKNPTILYRLFSEGLVVTQNPLHLKPTPDQILDCDCFRYCIKRHG